MGRTNIAFLQSSTQGGGGTQCDDVVINPNDAVMPVNVEVSTTAGQIIFYRISSAANVPSPGLAPEHNGANAISPTVSVGGSVGNVNVSGGIGKYLRCVAYKSGLLDSNITNGVYTQSS